MDNDESPVTNSDVELNLPLDVMLSDPQNLGDPVLSSGIEEIAKQIREKHTSAIEEFLKSQNADPKTQTLIRVRVDHPTAFVSEVAILVPNTLNQGGSYSVQDLINKYPSIHIVIDRDS